MRQFGEFLLLMQQKMLEEVLVTGGGLGRRAINNTIKSGEYYTGGKGENGTGGLLVIYANQIDNNGNITANGCAGGEVTTNSNSASGGASGGGSINIFYNNTITGIEKITATGGISNSGGSKGGAGGTGSITVGSIATGNFDCVYKNY